MNRNNASVIQNDWALKQLEKTGNAAQFERFKDGSAAILLRPNATRYQLIHELMHYQHWLQNKSLYAGLSKLAREEFVFKSLKESHHWKHFTELERRHAEQQIEWFRRIFKNGGN